MNINRCPIPERNSLASCKRRMSIATTPLLGPGKPHCAGTRRQVRLARRRRFVPTNLRIAFRNVTLSPSDLLTAAAGRLSCLEFWSNQKLPSADVKRLGDASKWIAARRRSAQSAAEISARSHANGVAPQCHLQVAFIVNAAPPNGEHWIREMRADVSRGLMNAPGENE